MFSFTSCEKFNISFNLKNIHGFYTLYLHSITQACLIFSKLRLISLLNIALLFLFIYLVFWFYYYCSLNFFLVLYLTNNMLLFNVVLYIKSICIWSNTDCFFFCFRTYNSVSSLKKNIRVELCLVLLILLTVISIRLKKNWKLSSIALHGCLA